MGRKRHTPEELVAKLRQVDVLVSQGQTVDREGCISIRKAGAPLRRAHEAGQHLSRLSAEEDRKVHVARAA